jgi:hypothetical protein
MPISTLVADDLADLEDLPTDQVAVSTAPDARPDGRSCMCTCCNYCCTCQGN